MNTQQIFWLEEKYEMNLYPKRGIALERGEKEFVWDTEGRKYIDCTTGVGIAILGHAHPALLKAINTQTSKIMTCYETFYNEERGKLEQKLVNLFGGKGRVMLSNSGTESVEAAIKLARKHTQRKGFVAAMNAFHGRSSGALSLTYKEKYRAPFEPLLNPVARVRLNDIEMLKGAVTSDTAAVVLEVIQGESGVRIGNGEYLKAAQDICKDKGALFILDEVQTGCGRTGKFFAFEHYDLSPDIACLAKGLAGGVPIGATIAKEEVATFAPLEHGTTFGGNPLASAAANSVLETIEKEQLLDKVAGDGTYMLDKFRTALASKTNVREIRGKGLMMAVELRGPVKQVLADLAEKGVLALPAGEQVLRFLPPFIISRGSIDEVVSKVAEVLT